jgi:diaminohydroxyphosphoribosylaminopyrimidine deaminase/5-amino-6-(5-phosphoribosylamino)uracil reductase
MQRALALARLGSCGTQPNPRVGCVIVRDGRVVGEGWHRRAGEPHAEVHALRAAGDQAQGATVFVTLEPCAHHGRTPPCAEALIAARPARVIAAMRDPNPRVAGRGIALLQAAGIAAEVGLCEAEARLLNRGFVSRFERGRPWLTLKLAASLDGRSALRNGASRWITGAAARADVHRLRAEAGAVLVGADTALADDPALTVRDWMPTPQQWLHRPDRIVLDSGGRVPATARVWADDGARRFWLTGAAAPPAPAGVEQIRFGTDAAGRLPFADVLRTLAEREINEVLVEAGPQLSGALLQAGVPDELLLYLAPVLLGGTARPLALLPELERLQDATRLSYTDVQRVGPDLRVTLQPAAA